MSQRRTRLHLGVLLVALIVLVLLSARTGSTGMYSWSDTYRGTMAFLGLGEPLARGPQHIVELRILRTLCSAGIGCALAVSGALLQGVFRNDLASPSLLGVTTGASFGASMMIVALGGYGPDLLLENLGGSSPLLVSTGAFVGALGVTAIVTLLATTGGRISVPTLLLVGIAMNAMMGGLLTAVQSLMLDDFDVARAIFAWGFGILDDRTAVHLGLLVAGILPTCLALPYLARELDLLAGGEEDALALGVHVGRVKWIALGCAALCAAVSVAVAGQIAFVGLVVPHLLRRLGGRHHSTLLPLCALGGPVFLLGTDLLQRALLGDAYLKPGVLMSVIGGPFFLILLVLQRKRMRSW